MHDFAGTIFRNYSASVDIESRAQHRFLIVGQSFVGILKTKIQGGFMYSNTAASYTPDFQVIRFKSIFQPFSDPDDLKHFETPHQMGFFIHEWIHFLHNVSTIHGISAYGLAAILWSNVRTHIYGVEFECNEEQKRSNNLDIQKQFKHRLYIRKSKNNNLPAGLKPADVRFLTVDEHVTFIDEDPMYKCTDLVCKVEIGGADEQLVENVSIGCHEIVESVAYMLEAKYLSLKKEVPLPASVDPYHLVKGLASFVCPDVSIDAVLKCALLSLQHPDPPALLIGFLKGAQENIEKGIDPAEKLTEAARKYLSDNLQAMSDTFDLVESFCVVDEPMARAIKYTVRKMRNNYKHRISEPFFEIDLIDAFANDGESALFLAIEKFGVGYLIQERAGDDDKPMRDLMYDISTEDLADSDLSIGRRIAQAAFTYVFQFFKNDPDNLTEPTQLECPFYKSCNAKFRLTHANACKTTPWITQDLSLDEICFFGRAVLNTKGKAA